MTKVNKDFENIPTILTDDSRREAFANNIQSHDYVDNSNLYKVSTVQKELERIYHLKCAYCEKDISDDDKHIEHYRPKKRYYWLAYSWDNLLLSCGKCNRKKGDRFLTQECSVLYGNESFDAIHTIGMDYDLLEKPMIINPEKDDILEEILFDSDGKISSQNERIQYTIDKACNLNRNSLIEHRIKIFNQFKRRVVKYISKQDADGLITEIESFIEECKVENEYYSFRYFVTKNSMMFFTDNTALQTIIYKLFLKYTPKGKK